MIRLNPADFLVNGIEENKIHVYCICPTPHAAAMIETLEMSKEQIDKYWASQA